MIVNKSRSLRRMLTAAVVAFPAVGLTQTRPDSGVLLESVKPVPAPASRRDESAMLEAPARSALASGDSNVTIAVKGLRITRNRAFSRAQLLPLVNTAIGEEATLAQLQALAEHITNHYRHAGYLLAVAYIPTQDIVGGVVEIAVLEGRLGNVQVENTSRLTNEQVTRRLSGLKEGSAIESGSLEKSLLLLDDLRGVEVNSTLKPGASVGTTDLDIRLTAQQSVASALELDDYGNRYTGKYRLGVLQSACQARKRAVFTWALESLRC
jgi:hemolysin activation/secretion protein